MNLQNLSLGQVVPNYRALCRLLNEPIKGGKSKECQLDEWARHFAFDRLPNSNAYIITEIYDHVMPEWASDKTLYTHLIELLLMHELAKLPKGQNTCSYTKTNLFQALGMVNSYYLRCNHYLIAQDIKHIPRNGYDGVSLIKRGAFVMRGYGRRTEIYFYLVNIFVSGNEFSARRDFG